jgi:ketosteroid isomerase-like protein
VAERTTTSERDRVRSVIEDYWRALGAKNAEQALRHCAPDLVQYSMAPPLRAICPDAKALAAWFATWRGPIGLESRDLAITAGTDVAFCTSLNRMTGTSSGGEEVDLWFRSTVGLRKIDGEWRIAHEHESVPFYMDGSYRAALDLAP